MTARTFCSNSISLPLPNDFAEDQSGFALSFVRWRRGLGMFILPDPLRFIFLLAALVIAAPAYGQSGGGVAGSQASFKVVRSVSGSRGSQQAGRYVIADPRTTFHIPADKQAIVYFDWDGPLGRHHFEGIWKGPDDKIAFTSNFDFEVKTRRFGAYWQFDFRPELKPGFWTLEAQIDGEAAGSHKIELVVSGNAAPPVVAGPPLLTSAQIYERGLKSTVTIENLAADGRKLRTGSGFVIGEDAILTAFQVIDGSSSLRILLPDGKSGDLQGVSAWNRLQDWALLRVKTEGIPKLTRAPAAGAVGDRVYSFDQPTPGNRILVDEGIVGLQTYPEMGPRINLTSLATPGSQGAPVLNEYGNVIGVLGGSLTPGMENITESRNTLALGGTREGSMATPVTAVPTESAGALKSLAEIAAGGEFVSPVKSFPSLIYGSIGTHIDDSSPLVSPFMERQTEFSHRDNTCLILLVWAPHEKLRDEVSLALYDIHNKVVASSKPLKLNVEKGVSATQKFEFPLAQLPQGVYRADALVNKVPVWRAFLRITD